MSDFILIFLGIFILLLIILIFILLAYVYNTYVSYTIEINKNLNDSENIINDTNRAFNKLQDNVVNNIATVKTNQEVILENNKNKLDKLDANLLNILDIKNDGTKLGSILSSNIDNNKSLDIDIKSKITAFKELNVLTNSNQYVNICNSTNDASKRKCVNMNIDNLGNFNIYTKNKLANNIESNIANIAFRDINDNILAEFNSSNNSISLGSNENPAIYIKNNIYTPDIIVCNYNYIPEILPVAEIPGTATTSNIPAVSGSPPKIKLTFISNFNIKKDIFICFNILDNIIDSISTPNTIPLYNNILYDNSTKLIKFKSNDDIIKDTIKEIEIPFTKIAGASIDINKKYNTIGYIKST